MFLWSHGTEMGYYLLHGVFFFWCIREAICQSNDPNRTNNKWKPNMLTPIMESIKSQQTTEKIWLTSCNTKHLSIPTDTMSLPDGGNKNKGLHMKLADTLTGISFYYLPSKQEENFSCGQMEFFSHILMNFKLSMFTVNSQSYAHSS